MTTSASAVRTTLPVGMGCVSQTVIRRVLNGTCSPEQEALLAAGWNSIASAVLPSAGMHFKRWAVRQLERDSLGLQLLQRAGHAGGKPEDWAEVVGRIDEYWRIQSDHRRIATGQHFTPEWLSDLLVKVAAISSAPRSFGRILDPACGTGTILRSALRARLGRAPVEEVVDSIVGLERDPVALLLAKLTLIATLARNGHAVTSRSLPDLRLHVTKDALEPALPLLVPSGHKESWEVRALAGDHSSGFAAVLMNPPYLEAKRMRSADPGLSGRLRAWFPGLEGAYDLYMAFLARALEWVRPGGFVGAVLPNKFLVAKYAERMRREFLAKHHVATIVDVSRVEGVFSGTSVYPILFVVQRGRAPRTRRTLVVQAKRMRTGHVGLPSPRRLALAQTAAAFEHRPFFVPFPETFDIVLRLLRQTDLVPLRSRAELRSTCSFHSKGLRERFIVDRLDRLPSTERSSAHPYLGGVSYSRMNEVNAFTIRWSGHWIRYDNHQLKRLGNPLPPIDRFIRPKVVFCQHSQRPRAYADLEGRWVTKDVYPIALPRLPHEFPVECIAAVLNSTVFSMLYNTVYHGITIGGEFYHYLPSFMADVPVPPRLTKRIPPLVRQIQDDLEAGDLATAQQVALSLDDAVADAYGLSERELEIARVTHLDRLRVPLPWD